jgi:hypothetical protein
MEYSSEYRRQERKDTGIVISKRVLFNEAYLLTNATVVDDAIRFVSSKSKQNTNSNEGDTEESNEPDYDEDKDQLEEEQEEETGETSEATRNQVF